MLRPIITGFFVHSTLIVTAVGVRASRNATVLYLLNKVYELTCFDFYFLLKKFEMNHFDLFLQASDNFPNSGIFIDTKLQQHKHSNINFYVLDEPVYSISNIVSTSSNKKYSIIRFINLNAKAHQQYRDINQETSEDRDKFLSNILHTFISNVENKFSSSNAIREVMMSSSASVFICVLLTNKEDYKYKVVGGCYYTCSPLFGVLVPLMIVNEDYHKKGLGSNFLR